eukprot:4941505-Prymnesium_polylepis.1
MPADRTLMECADLADRMRVRQKGLTIWRSSTRCACLPASLPGAGAYVVQWRWDCEESSQI